MQPKNQDAEINLLINLSGYVDSKISPKTWHSLGVAKLAMNIAQNLSCSESEIQQVCLAALFHDVGKIGIPEQILSKPGPLNNGEWSIMRLHPVIGASIVEAMDIKYTIGPSIKFHQERYNGSGYPDGLQGEEIPFGARILAVVDAYDAMINDRVYRKALEHQNALSEIRIGRGKDFDPQVTDAFLQTIDDC